VLLTVQHNAFCIVSVISTVVQLGLTIGGDLARADFQLPHTPNCVYARTHAMGQRPAREAQLLVRKFT
jgi:hypothetical protein